MPKRTIINLRTLVAQKGLKDYNEGRRDKTRYTYEEIAEAADVGMSTVTSMMNDRNSRVDIPVIDKLLDWLGDDVDWGDLMKRVEVESTEGSDEESGQIKTPLAAAG
jgi:transcriptional regulator with XRE-family HTH domain